MNLLPYHRFEITSPMKRAEALAAIASRIEERKWLRWRWPSVENDERFDGAVTETSFSVTRIMGYRNSFAPVIEGEVHESGRFSRIVITMKRHIVVLLFLVVFAGMMLAGLVALERPLPGVLMLLLLYAIVLGAFWFEANKLEQTLRKIFQAM
ncbi:MAG: hypothetical protein AB7H66_03585 [Hyphomonadaceae bacterium]